MRENRICASRLIRNIQREPQVICNITESTIKIERRRSALRRAMSMPSSMRTDGMYNFMTDVLVHVRV